MNQFAKIKVQDFNGRKHFVLFSNYTDPTYGITSLVDITTFYQYVKNHEHPIYLSLIYLVTKALNQVNEFRYRYNGEDILFFDKIDPAFTIMTDVGLYDNCDNVDIRADFATFLQDAKREIADIKKGQALNNPQIDERFDQFYFSSTPWMEFSAITHPMDNTLLAYIPRITWDKFHIEEEKVTMHININVHHALISGKPLADGFNKIQAYLNNPQDVFE
ncbi:MAG TPA: CatA-like O-acetyltransferase [Bacilli bacterium]|nr:CatA-like O-acetyltransferase [Bacilli bacterium]